MVREFIIARYFGATAAKDAFVIANNVPAIFGLLIAAFLNVFLPVFIRIREQKGEIEAWRLGSKVFTVLFLLVIASSALMFLLAGPSVSLLAGGLDQERHYLATVLTQYLTPLIFLSAFLTYFSNLLRSYQHFLLPVMASFISSFVLFGLVILYAPSMNIMALVLGSVGSGLFLLLAVGGGVFYGKPYLRLNFHWRDANLAQIVRLAIPLAIGGSVGLINLIVDRTIGSYLPIGSISTIDYAQKIFAIPLLFISSLTYALYPSLSISWARHEREQFRHSLGQGLVAIWFIILPSAAGLISLGKPLISVVLQTGAFTQGDTAMTATILTYYALGLFATAGCGILVNSLIVLGNTITPMFIGFITVGINIGLNILFAFVFGMGAPGLALATTISDIFYMFALILPLKRKTGACIFRGLWVSVWKTILAAGMMGGACYFLWLAIEQATYLSSYWLRLGLLLLLVLFGVGLYGLLSWLFRIPEFERYLGYVRRIVARFHLHRKEKDS